MPRFHDGDMVQFRSYAHFRYLSPGMRSANNDNYEAIFIVKSATEYQVALKSTHHESIQYSSPSIVDRDGHGRRWWYVPNGHLKLVEPGQE